MIIINNINSQWSSWSRRCSKSAGGVGQFSPTSLSQGNRLPCYGICLLYLFVEYLYVLSNKLVTRFFLVFFFCFNKIVTRCCETCHLLYYITYLLPTTFHTTTKAMPWYIFFSGKKVLRSQCLLVSGNKHHIVRFPYCHECHCQWVGEPDYILPDMKIMWRYPMIIAIMVFSTIWCF